ncbi:MAG: sugar kinase [Clostridiales bacterium]|nr:sugar kinase [Clostridiales bacterium]
MQQLKIATFGEVLLRLMSPGHERLFQSPRLEATFGGSEANTAIALANFGAQAAFATVLPDNDVGSACLREMRAFGLDVSAVRRKPGRMGLYFLETGAMQRPSKVVYDRAGSAMALAEPGDVDWDRLLEGATWFHFSGITPAVSASAAALALEGVRAAHQKGLRISCDLNYRRTLWRYGRQPIEVMPEIVRYVDTLLANEEAFRLCMGVHLPGMGDDALHMLNLNQYADLCARAMEAYPALRVIGLTMRESTSADDNTVQGCLYTREGMLESPTYRMGDIVDRVGGGDSFAAGLIWGLNRYESPQDALNFAMASGVLKHTIPGDFNRVSAEEVEALMGGDGGGRVQR